MLIDDYMRDCVLIETDKVPDSEGGSRVTYRNTVPFRAAIVQNAPSETRRAEQLISAPGYTVTMPKTTPAVYGSIFRCREEGTVFRLTSDPHEIQSPLRATFSLMQASAERLEVDA